MAIYTRQGDLGETGLIGSRTKKSDLRIHVVGELDEVMVLLGKLLTDLEEEKSSLVEELEYIYQQFFRIQTIIVDIENKYGFEITDQTISFLENKIDGMERDLPPLQNFIYYTGHPLALLSQQIRVKIRLVERLAVKLNERDSIDPFVLRFLNRSSDYFYILGRYINKMYGYQEKIMRL